jgi:hypothetical protein
VTATHYCDLTFSAGIGAVQWTTASRTASGTTAELHERLATTARAIAVMQAFGAVGNSVDVAHANLANAEAPAHAAAKPPDKPRTITCLTCHQTGHHAGRCPTATTCIRCGKAHNYTACTLDSSTLKCTSCGRVGHLAVACLQKKQAVCRGLWRWSSQGRPLRPSRRSTRHGRARRGYAVGAPPRPSGPADCPAVWHHGPGPPVRERRSRSVSTWPPRRKARRASTPCATSPRARQRTSHSSAAGPAQPCAAAGLGLDRRVGPIWERCLFEAALQQVEHIVHHLLSLGQPCPSVGLTVASGPSERAACPRRSRWRN